MEITMKQKNPNPKLSKSESGNLREEKISFYPPRALNFAAGVKAKAALWIILQHLGPVYDGLLENCGRFNPEIAIKALNWAQIVRGQN